MLDQIEKELEKVEVDDEELAGFREIVAECEVFTWDALLNDDDEDEDDVVLGGSQDGLIIVDKIFCFILIVSTVVLITKATA